MTTKRNELLVSRIRPVGHPPDPPTPPRPFDVFAAVALLDALMTSGATIAYDGMVRTRRDDLAAAVGAARATGLLWEQCLAFLSHFHDHVRWAAHVGVPDSVVKAEALEAAGRVAEEIGHEAADVLAAWLRRVWSSARRCMWCGGFDGQHESRGRKGSWQP